MQSLRLAVLALAALLAVGCSSPPQPIHRRDTRSAFEIALLRLGKPALTLAGTGKLTYVCTRDAKGRYWRLAESDVTLSQPGSRRAIVRQRQDFSFVSPDGSMLTSRIELWQSGATTGDLKSVLFKTRSRGFRGRLTGIQHVLRDEAQGGQPQTLCSPIQVGHRRVIPFTARYRFYRN